MASSAVIIVPARMQSSRLPGKPLADIKGRPMILRVLDRAKAAGFACEHIIAAVDGQELADIVSSSGFNSIVTDPLLPSGSDRVCAAACEAGYADDTIIVNLQGDEPAMPVEPLIRVVTMLQENPAADWATLACEGDGADLQNPNVVKVVCDVTGRALYFSRSAIPHDRSARQFNEAPACLRHIGLYAYRLGALKAVTSEPPCALERREGLEQLRALYLGQTILVDIIEHTIPHGVDTEADLVAMRARDWTSEAFP